MELAVLLVLVFLVAILYASAGFGGASGYLLVMSFFGIPSRAMSSMALVLNIAVSSIAFLNYRRAGHFQARLLSPFLVTSLPAAFLGGTFVLPDKTYRFFLYAVLTYLALRMVFLPTLAERREEALRSPPLWAALGSGAIIGLLSGMIGIGGGIFLAPLIVLAGWGTAKQAAASAGAFIALNSLSGLAGRLVAGTFSLGGAGLLLLAAGILGALIGSRLGALRFSNATVRRLLGIVLLVAVGMYWLNLA